MGFHATESCLPPVRPRTSRARLSGNPTPTRKNRVWNFLATCATSVRVFASQPAETVSETSATLTISVSGVRYYVYRLYEPPTGRWLNRDPITEKGFRLLQASRTRKTSNNTYFFVGNSPQNYIDPLGLSWLGDAWNWLKKKFGLTDKTKCDDKCDNKELIDLLLVGGSTLPKIGNLVTLVTTSKGCLDAAKGPCKDFAQEKTWSSCIACCTPIVIQLPGGTQNLCVQLCKPLQENP
jgi:RHS repeat-associated protein